MKVPVATSRSQLRDLHPGVFGAPPFGASTFRFHTHMCYAAPMVSNGASAGPQFGPSPLALASLGFCGGTSTSLSTTCSLSVAKPFSELAMPDVQHFDDHM